jgi:heterotetrameric sarcosine oxidase gamma subunit
MADRLVPVSALPRLSNLSGGGVSVSERDGLGMAVALARKGRADALAARVKERFDIALPRGPQRATNGSIAFAGTGPETWLVTAENAADVFATLLRSELQGDAAVIDQSGGYAVLRVTGPKAREALAKGVPLDLHTRAFKVGDVASPLVSHIPIVLWRLEDAPDGSPVFEIAVFRSLADGLGHWLSESSAEFKLFE